MVFITMAELTAALSMWALKKTWNMVSYMIWGQQATPEQIEIKKLRESIEEIKKLQLEKIEIDKYQQEKNKELKKQEEVEKRKKKIEEREAEIDEMHQSFRLSYMSQSCPNLADLRPNQVVKK